MLPPDPKKMAPGGPVEAVADPLELAGEPLPPGAPPAAVTAPPGLGALLHALRRCWLWAVPVAAVAGLLAAFASLVVYPGSYSSSLVLRLNTRAAHGSTEDEGHFSNVQRAYVAKLLSHEVLAEAIRQSGVAEKYGVSYTPQTLARKLSAQFITGPEVMTVTLTGESPEALAAVLNALGEIYPRKVAAEEEARVKARIAQLRRRLDLGGDRRDPGRALTLAEQLHDKRNELLRAEKEAGLDDAAALRAKYQHAMNQLARAQGDHAARKQELAGLQAKKGATGEPIPAEITALDIEEAIGRNPDYQDAQKVIRELEERIARAQHLFTGPQLERATARDRKLLNEWKTYRQRIREDVRQKLQRKADAQAAQERRRAADEARAREAQLARQVEGLDKDIQFWTKKVEELQSGGPKAPPEVEALRDQVKQLEEEFKVVGSQIAALEGSLPLPPRVTRLAEAFAPQERDTGRAQKIAMALGVLTFLGVVAGLCLLEASGRRVSSSNDLVQGLGMRLLGVLPRLPASARTKSAAAQALGGLDSRYGLTEAVDAIRTVLMHSPRNDGARVVLVSSALGGEGKTTLASHLAASLARAWRKTLLIDGDLRKPALHAQFDQPLEPGLSEALRGEIDFEETIRPTMTSRLWLMPAGRVDGHALQALPQEGLEAVFEQLKEQYDFIVMDSSPVLLVPDGLLLAQRADTVVLAMMKDHSRLPAVYAAQQKLEALGIRVLGGVLIGEKLETYGHAVPYPR